MANESVNKFYTRFLFKMDTPPQNVVSMLDTEANFSKERVIDIRRGTGTPKATKWNQSPGKIEDPFGQKRVYGMKNKTRAIKAELQPEIGSLNTRTFMGMLGGKL